MTAQLTKFSIIASLVIAFTMFLAPSFSPLHAQQSPCTGSDCVQSGLNDIGGAFPGGAKQGADVREILKTIIDWALYLAAIIAVIFIIIGGFMYITSAGDATKATTGRKTLTNAIIGLVIIVMSYLIVQVVYNFLTRR
jgi:amino acid transporter